MPQTLNPVGLYMNLVEWSKFFNPDGSLARIVRMLTQRNDLMNFLDWRESNMMTGERTTVETSLPVVSDRIINKGVVSSFGEVEQIDEQCAIMESWFNIDEEQVRIGGSEAAFRSSQFAGFAEKFSQQVNQRLLYANSQVNPAQILGIMPRYSSATAANAQNILNGGGVGSSNLSILLVQTGEGLTSGLFAKGTKAGIEHVDWGKRIISQVASTPDTGIGTAQLVVWSSQFKQHYGLNIADWTSVVRACNIDVTQLANNNAPVSLPELMIRMLERPRSLSAGKTAFIMNRTARQYLRLQMRADVKLGGQLNYDVVDGKRTAIFQEVPILICDQMLNTEAAVTGLPAINNI